jgi:hypothetical protein
MPTRNSAISTLLRALRRPSGSVLDGRYGSGSCNITDDVLWRATRRADDRRMTGGYGRDAGPSTATAGYPPHQPPTRPEPEVGATARTPGAPAARRTPTGVDTPTGGALAAPIFGLPQGRTAVGCITDDNLWRPTRRAKEHYTKDELTTRRGAVHSIGWLSPGRTAVCPRTLSTPAELIKRHEREHFFEPELRN